MLIIAKQVFTRDELEFVAQLCIEHNVTVISDEVYYRLVHPPHQHIPIGWKIIYKLEIMLYIPSPEWGSNCILLPASLPGMWDRTITVGSAGKCFSVTGWRTGWCIGPEHLINIIAVTHRTSAYSGITPLQVHTLLSIKCSVWSITGPLGAQQMHLPIC